MCGIAGFSLDPESSVDRTLAAQALLSGIAERGADAVGYAHRGAENGTRVTKLRGGASALVDELAVPPEAGQALIHVRDFTKGHPDIAANNHPIRHGAVVGIHNGIVLNDDALARARNDDALVRSRILDAGDAEVPSAEQLRDPDYLMSPGTAASIRLLNLVAITYSSRWPLTARPTRISFVSGP